MADRVVVVIVAVTEYDHPISYAPLTHQLDEVSTVLRTFFQPIALLGRVTERELADELAKGAAGFWFAGHASSAGLALTDGILAPTALGLYLSRAGVRWSYLNTCDSGALVAELQAVHPHDLFANIVPDVADAVAARNGVLFAQAIADTGDLIMAYHWLVSGKPSILRYFPAPNGESMIRGDGLKTASDDRIRRLEKVVWGDPDTRFPALVDRAILIDRRLRRLEIMLIAEALIVLVAGVLLWTRPPTVVIQVGPGGTPIPTYVAPPPYLLPGDPGFGTVTPTWPTGSP